jgi:hypothetical protein
VISDQRANADISRLGPTIVDVAAEAAKEARKAVKLYKISASPLPYGFSKLGSKRQQVFM